MRWTLASSSSSSFFFFFFLDDEKTRRDQRKTCLNAGEERDMKENTGERDNCYRCRVSDANMI